MLMLLFFSSLFSRILLLRGELWKEDLSSAMNIGLSTTGYKSVDLRCDSDHFSVNLTLEREFEGVVYTRGSFADKKLPCFKRHDQGSIRDKILLISLKIPFHRCRTVMDVAESRYTNTLVVQHDAELIMPGDAAFLLDCAFVPEFKEQADVRRASTESFSDLSFKSRITLIDADPATKAEPDKQNITVASSNEKVSFVPNGSATKDEL